MTGDNAPPLRRMPSQGSSRRYVVFIYRLPSQAEAARMRVWRQLRRLGALALQQGVYILPRTAATVAALTRVARCVGDAGGTTHVLPLRSLPPAEEATIVAGLIAQSTCQDEDSSAEGPSSTRDTARRAEAVDSSAHKGSPCISAAQRGGHAGRMDACDVVSVRAAP